MKPLRAEIRKFNLHDYLAVINLTLISIAQARTGTGKTLGFLIPVVQNILNKSPELAKRSMRYERARASDIRGIIISPTRELAEQIAVEARRITRNTGIKVQVAVGGNSKAFMLRQMQREGCHLLVATPGRLNDLLTDPYSKVSAPDLSTLVLDEADRLLDAGFADEIEDIMKSLPDIRMQDRQTLLFSATVPREVMGLVRKTLKHDFQFVQTIQKGEQATHNKIPQKIVQVAGLENLMPTLLELCKREIEKTAQPDAAMPFKALVYFSSTANVELASMTFENLKAPGGSFYAKHPLWPAEISLMHGKLTQQQRTRVSDRFRRARSAIMFSSDVTARGMDFPNVTHVIQVGLPPDRDQYIHRIGRTGRGDKSGEGWLFIASMETRTARSRLRGLPLQPDTSLQTAVVDMTRDAQLDAPVAETLRQVSDASKMVDRETKTGAYMANLGVLKGSCDSQDLIDALNQLTRFGWGWEEPPAINKKLADRLGLSRLSGVVTKRSSSLDDLQGEDFNGGGAYSRNDRWSSGSSRGGGGGGFGGGRGRSSDGRGRGSGRDGGFGQDRASRGRDGGFGRDKAPRQLY
jgi:ATP-dependent RNA helicase MSS116, mitochondrial